MMHRRRLPSEMQEQIMEGLAQGFTPEYIAMHVGVTPQTVRNYRKRYGDGTITPAYPERQVWTEEMENDLFRIVESGIDMYKITYRDFSNAACRTAYTRAMKRRGIKRVVMHVSI